MPNTVPGLTFRTLPRFDASSPTASLVSSILQSANRLHVSGAVGNSTHSLTLVAYLLSNWVVSLRYPEQYCTTMVASQYIFCAKLSIAPNIDRHCPSCSHEIW